MFTQILDPTGNLFLTWLVALIPVVLLLFLLAGLRMSAWLAVLIGSIVTFLLAHGYSDNAAAGIAGNMYQESKGDPESVGMGGGGLIGFTPLPSGYVTGNPAADLQTQLNAVLTYNQGWASYLPALNAAASPADAAYIYVTDFERAGIPAVLVGDIHRGGVFAHLYGTVSVLPPDLRQCIHAFIINMFRGDPDLLGDAACIVDIVE